MKRALALLVAVAAGCFPQLRSYEGAKCSADEPCPDPLQCIAAQCARLDAGSVDAGWDGGASLCADPILEADGGVRWSTVPFAAVPRGRYQTFTLPLGLGPVAVGDFLPGGHDEVAVALPTCIAMFRVVRSELQLQSAGGFSYPGLPATRLDAMRLGPQAPGLAIFNRGARTLWIARLDPTTGQGQVLRTETADEFAVVDIDNDKRDDLVVINGTGGMNLSLRVNDGGSFNTPTGVPAITAAATVMATMKVRPETATLVLGGALDGLTIFDVNSSGGSTQLNTTPASLRGRFPHIAPLPVPSFQGPAVFAVRDGGDGFVFVHDAGALSPMSVSFPDGGPPLELPGANAVLPGGSYAGDLGGRVSVFVSTATGLHRVGLSYVDPDEVQVEVTHELVNGALSLASGQLTSDRNPELVATQSNRFVFLFSE